MSKLAVILVRGFLDMNEEIKETLRRLNLQRKLCCVVIESTPSVKGMIEKVRNFVTFGEIDEDTYKLLVEKRGKVDVKGNPVPFFRMHPPRGGFERKGIKKGFSAGGVLGYRGDAINTLIKKML